MVCHFVVRSHRHGTIFIDLRYSLLSALCVDEYFCTNAV